MTADSDEVRDGSVRPVIDESLIDRLMDQVDAEGLELLGPDGVLTELTSRVLSRGLEVEMAEHLGYEKGDPAGWGSGNNRNGAYEKTVQTDAGSVPVVMPRDRESSFEPKLIPKHARRLSGFNELVISLVARGMTVRDTQAHLAEIYGVDVSPELISKVTDAVIPELRAWQQRPLDPMYPIVYLDAIVVKVRTDHVVVNRPVYIAMAIDLEGAKHVLGLWLGKGDEGAKFWLGILTELKNRGVGDVLIVCCDGLTGFPDAIEAVWPQTVVQTCVVHLIRNSVRYASWKHRKLIVKELRPVYTAATVEAAAAALDQFEAEWGDQGGFNWWLQHLDDGGGVCRCSSMSVCRRSGRCGGRCGRRAGRRLRGVRTGSGFGRRSLVACRLRMLLRWLGCRRRLGRGGSARLGGCRHLRWFRYRAVTCRFLSVKRSPS